MDWRIMLIRFMWQCRLKFHAKAQRKRKEAIHDRVDMGIGFILDLIVCDKVIIELKSVETYKFKIPLIKDGIHRIVNNL